MTQQRASFELFSKVLEAKTALQSEGKFQIIPMLRCCLSYPAEESCTLTPAWAAAAAVASHLMVLQLPREFPVAQQQALTLLFLSEAQVPLPMQTGCCSS